VTTLVHDTKSDSHRMSAFDTQKSTTVAASLASRVISLNRCANTG